MRKYLTRPYIDQIISLYFEDDLTFRGYIQVMYTMLIVYNKIPSYSHTVNKYN